MKTLFEKREQLREVLRQFSPLLIAYSGGVDSAYLLAEARATLGAQKMQGVIADSASLPRKALERAIALASAWDAPLEVIRTEELDNPQYASNPFNRCYFCKAELFKQLERMAGERKFCALAYGENADDARQVRPGRQAAAEFSVLAPLRDVGLTKADIRTLSREMGLPTADAPAQPCLSSRIPHGTPVTVDALAMVEAGEDWVRSLGFSVFRVRHLIREKEGISAKLQIDPSEMERVPELKEQLESGLLSVGYQSVELDPEGYRPS